MIGQSLMSTKSRIPVSLLHIFVYEDLTHNLEILGKMQGTWLHYNEDIFAKGRSIFSI